MGMLGEVHTAARQVIAVRSQLESLKVKIATMPDVAGALDQFDETTDSILNQLYEPKARAGNDLINYPMRLSVRIAYLEDEVDYGDGAPTGQFRRMTAEYRAVLDAELAKWKLVVERDLPALNRQLAAHGLPEIKLK
jgi:hypothetical protein